MRIGEEPAARPELACAAPWWTRLFFARNRKRPLSASEENGQLLVGDAGTGGAGERHDLNVAEAGFFAPAGEVGAGVVERVAELDQHDQGHDQPERVVAARVVNDVLGD